MKSVFWPFVEEEREMLAQKENYRRREASGSSGMDFVADLDFFPCSGGIWQTLSAYSGGGALGTNNQQSDTVPASHLPSRRMKRTINTHANKKDYFKKLS